MITDEMFAKGKFWTKGPMLVTGCTKVSPGCKNYWSEKAHVMRSKGPNRHVWPLDCLTDGRFNGKVQFNLDRLEDAAKGKKPQVIAIWNDLYHEGVTLGQIDSAIKLMEENSQHTFLVITKRPERAVKAYGFIPNHHWRQNIIHIATMENQDMVNKRQLHLLNIPGKRGIIIEPMLGPIDLKSCLGLSELKAGGYEHTLKNLMPAIHQVILGPENGKGKREFKEEWAESVKVQCEGAGVPFYRKDKGKGELIWK